MRSRVKICKYCGRVYIKPCDADDKAKSCPNTKLDAKVKRKKK